MKKKNKLLTTNFLVVEKKNKNAIHCIADSKERAENWINNKAPQYVKLGYFTDKSLTEDSFTIIEKTF